MSENIVLSLFTWLVVEVAFKLLQHVIGLAFIRQEVVDFCDAAAGGKLLGKNEENASLTDKPTDSTTPDHKMKLYEVQPDALDLDYGVVLEGDKFSQFDGTLKKLEGLVVELTNSGIDPTDLVTVTKSLDALMDRWKLSLLFYLTGTAAIVLAVGHRNLVYLTYASHSISQTDAFSDATHAEMTGVSIVLMGLALLVLLEFLFRLLATWVFGKFSCCVCCVQCCRQQSSPDGSALACSTGQLY